MTRRTKIKICGITRPEDAALAVGVGADALGLNFYPGSPRFLANAAARELVAAAGPFVETYGVFVDATIEQIQQTVAETGIGAVQLCGDAPPETIAALAPLRVLRVFRWQGPETHATIRAYLDECQKLGRLPVGVLIDAFVAGQQGGTGRTWNWNAAGRNAWALPWILAGGLNADNVAAAVAQARPFAVDVAGGVESAPGVKDPQKLAAFVAAVDRADRAIQAEHEQTIDEKTLALSATGRS